jgi:hypothetical protein
MASRRSANWKRTSAASIWNVLPHGGYSVKYYVNNLWLWSVISLELLSLQFRNYAHSNVHQTRHLSPTLRQMNPVHTFPSCYLMIHFNIILPYILSRISFLHLI